MKDYYVYVYIDPRNFEEFYFGKGTGSRKLAHLKDDSDSEKTRRIRAIRSEGLEPIIKVIARGLSQHEALLVEKTLLWKLGKNLTNISSGHYSENFRPHDSMHLDLPGFDFSNGIYYYNIGEGIHRNWDDYRRYSFISAGQGKQWADSIKSFSKGDVIAAYLKRRGFVGIGIVTEEAQPIRLVNINGVPLLSLEKVAPRMDDNVASDDLCEWAAKVVWKVAVDRSKAKWQPKSGLFTTQLVKASLVNQPKTIKYLEAEFGVDLRKLAE